MEKRERLSITSCKLINLSQLYTTTDIDFVEYVSTNDGDRNVALNAPSFHDIMCSFELRREVTRKPSTRPDGNVSVSKQSVIIVNLAV